MRFFAVASLLALPLANVAAAQDESSAAQAASPSYSICCTIPALTEISFEFVNAMNSKTSRIGERFPIRLAAPLMVDGREIVPAGTPGEGEVIHADKSRFGGKPGELVLAVRWLDHKGIRIPLRSLRYASTRGKDNTGTAIAVAAAVGVVSMFVTGGEVSIPAGTLAYAKTRVAVTLVEPRSGAPTDVITTKEP